MKLSHTYPLLFGLAFLFPVHTHASTNSFSPTTPTMKDYTKMPSFISKAESPSTMIIYDTSGSMMEMAYNMAQTAPRDHDGSCNYSVLNGSNPTDLNRFIATKRYYGSFNNTAYYVWNSANNYFEKDDNIVGDDPEWSGNFLNWLTMRRVDIAKKVLTGGRTDTNDPSILVVHHDVSYDVRKLYDDTNAVTDTNGNTRHMTPRAGRMYYYMFDGTNYQNLRAEPVDSALTSSCGSNTWVVDTTSARFLDDVDLRIKVPLAELTYDSNNDGVMDTVSGFIQKNAQSIRFGVTTFNGSTGGIVQAYIGSSTADLVDQINSAAASGVTPLAETLYTVAGNYQQESTVSSGSGPRWATSSYDTGLDKDPFYFVNKGKYVPCSKPFVIMITDGQPTSDTAVDPPVSTAGSASPHNNNSYELENVAYWTHTTDLRPAGPYNLYDDTTAGDNDGDGYDDSDTNQDYDLTNDINDRQSMILYTVFAFGNGSTILEQAAINGSFIDKPPYDGLPNSTTAELAITDRENKEWDFDGNGTADHYAAASDGQQLENALGAMMNDILRSISSGTASSVISSSRRGEGAAYQAIFIPEYLDHNNNKVEWIGDLNAMFKDNNGNLREDTDQNGILDFKLDRVARIIYEDNKARVNLYYDADGDGHLDFDEDRDGDRGNIYHPIGSKDECDHNEDLDNDGHLDVFEDTIIRDNRLTSEDIDCDGVMDQTEDVNGNGIMDPGEDIDHDGRFDILNEDDDGDCHLDNVDEDADGDGFFDINEDFDGDGILNPGEDVNGNGALDLDEDLDNDGNLDINEDTNGNGVLDAGEDVDGDGILDLFNEDLDGDGFLDATNEDVNNNGILDAGEDLDGDNNLDLGEDHNTNGIMDLSEDNDGDGHLDTTNEDIDGDGVLDISEDNDGDGILDLVNEDLDGDGHLDTTNEDLNGDGHLDIVEDRDGDGILDTVNEDLDGDGHLDTTNEDVDLDGILDINEDHDGDGHLDVDEDSDGDGRLDTINEDVNGNGILDPGEDLDGDGHLDTISEDLDGDGNLDINEDFDGDGILNLIPEDLDGDGHLDTTNEDLDGDGNLDINEDHDGDGILDTVNEDLDGDGHLDTINEDVNLDGNLDINEDHDGDGLLGSMIEDLDGDGHLDIFNEDIDGDGILDINEDYDGDGILNLIPEDLDGDGHYDDGTEDIDGDGNLDNGEDVNCNGIIDTEDKDDDCRLDLKDEDVDHDNNLDYEEDIDQDGVCDLDEAAIDSTVDLLDMRFLWSAGKRLAIKNPDSRNVFTSFDSNADGWVEPNDVRSFGTGSMGINIANETNIYTYFNLPLPGDPGALAYDYDFDTDTTEDPDDLALLINYIRGTDDNSAFRSRFMVIDADQDGVEDNITWRLGDIINSSPISVQKPMENFDLLYNDDSYRLFSKKYLKRRHVLYVGANDGMLHAINGGFYDKKLQKTWQHRNSDYTPNNLNLGNNDEFCDFGPLTPTNPSPCTTSVPELGDELWAYIPYNLLPHLQWLGRKDYAHVFYVDRQARVADVKIFAEESICGTSGQGIYDPACIHPKGWGTILIGSMRFGGGPITVDSNDTGILGDTNAAGNSDATLGSSYFVLDITDPESDPVFLGEFTFDDFSFTTSNPTILQMKNGASTSPHLMDWYLAFGTGPTTLKGQSDEQGKVYIMKLNYDPANNDIGTWVTSTQTTAGENWFGELTEDESFLSDLISVDFEIGTQPGAFQDDAIYFGSTFGGYPEKYVDVDNDGRMDVNEDIDGDGNLDINEDSNGNGILDAGEDIDGDGILDLFNEDIDGDGNLDVDESALLGGTDYDNDGIRDTGWDGNLYRVIINEDPDPANWLFGADDGTGFTTAAPFVEIGAPVTAAPSIATDDDNNVWVYAGTGRYLDELDDTDMDPQYLIGVKEPKGASNSGLIDSQTEYFTGANVLMSDLLDVTNARVYNGATRRESRVFGVAGVNTFEQLENTIENNYSGWKRELIQGLTERIISSPLVYGGGLFVNSYAPNREVCSAGGNSWTYGLYYKTGTAFYKPILGSDSNDTIYNPQGDPAERSLELQPAGAGKGGQIVIDDSGGKGGTKLNIQSSTGEIKQLNTTTPIGTDSGKLFWKNEF